METTNNPGSNVSPDRLRPLKWNELVRPGDFVEDGQKGFQPWEGPGGFRAASFVKKIFRLCRRPSGGIKAE
jgi:hypothetical protein